MQGVHASHKTFAQGLGFRGLGFRGLGFRGLGFRGLGFRDISPGIASLHIHMVVSARYRFPNVYPRRV